MKSCAKAAARRFANFFFRRVEPAELDVSEDRIVKQKRLLRDEPDLFAQRFLRHRAQIAAVDSYSAGSRIVETQDQRKNRALSRAARADERIGFSGLDLQIEIFHRIRDCRRRSGMSRLRNRCSPGRAELNRVGRVLDGRLRIQDRENFSRRRDGSLHHDVHPAQGFDRLVEEKNSEISAINRAALRFAT